MDPILVLAPWYVLLSGKEAQTYDKVLRNFFCFTSSSSNWSVITMAAASVVSGAGAIPRGDMYWV
jgi:hypothetical protein